MRNLSKEEKDAYNCMRLIAEYGGDNFLCRTHRNYLKTLLYLIELAYKT